nr:BLTX377 [Nephila pilipes]
MKKDVYL